MDPEVADDEQIANFVLESNKIRSDGNIHHRAFLPGKNDGERSVMRISGLSEEYAAANGQAFVGNPMNKTILGWGELSAAAIRTVNPLTVVADVPPPRHALIGGWPAAPEQRMALAMALAAKSTTRRWPPQV